MRIVIAAQVYEININISSPPNYEEILFFLFCLYTISVFMMVDYAFTWLCENSFIVYVSRFAYYIQMKYCCRYSLQGTNFANV